jgi:hypothetical protein
MSSLGLCTSMTIRMVSGLREAVMRTLSPDFQQKLLKGKEAI